MPTRQPQPAPQSPDTEVSHKVDEPRDASQAMTPQHREIGGRGGLEPTRFGDWEKNGRCIDF